MNYLGDIAEDATIDFKFTTRDFDTGAPQTLGGTPALSVYKANGTTESTAGITLTVDFDGRTGLNHVRIDTSADPFYAIGDYEVVITTGTVDGVSVVGEVVGSFSIENRFTNLQKWRGTAPHNMTNQRPLVHFDAATTNVISSTVLATSAVEEIRDAILSDATPFAGADIATLIARLTAARAGYLDNLNVGGNVASQSDVQSITQAQRVRVSLPSLLERPDAGSTPYRIWIYSYNEQHQAEDLDAVPTVTAETHTGVDRSANLSAVTKQAATNGIYFVDYTVADSHAVEGLLFKVVATEDAVATEYPAATIVVDTTAVDFSTADRAKLDELHDNRLTAARATLLDNLHTATGGVKLAAGVVHGGDGTRMVLSSADANPPLELHNAGFGVALQLTADNNVAFGVQGGTGGISVNGGLGDDLLLSLTPANFSVGLLDSIANAIWTDAARTLTGLGGASDDVTAACTASLQAAHLDHLLQAATTAFPGNAGSILGELLERISTWRFVTEALSQAPAGGATSILVNVMPSIVHGGEVKSGPLIAYVNGGDTRTLAISDHEGQPVDLSAASLRFVVESTTDGSDLLVKTTGGGGLTVGGAENNQVTVTYAAADVATLGQYRYALRDAATGKVWAEGPFSIRDAAE